MSRGYKGDFSIRSSFENLVINEQDEVVIALPLDGDLCFISEGLITKVKPIRKALSTDSNNYFYHNYSLEIKNELKNNNLLSDLEYSIKSVYRHRNPIVHFQQQYRDLPQQDYETIVKGWVYTTRTTFGKLINSLPRQNKLEFMLQAMDKFSTVDFKDISLQSGLEFLYNYIDKRILSRGKVIVETNKLIIENLADILPHTEIGFINPESKTNNNLSVQAALFEKLFALENNSNILQFINGAKSEDTNLEHRFLQIFKSETWPIDLTI